MSTKLRSSPFVTMNTDQVITKLVGSYTLETQDIIHKIADAERTLMIGCYVYADLEHNIKQFIEVNGNS